MRIPLQMYRTQFLQLSGQAQQIAQCVLYVPYRAEASIAGRIDATNVLFNLPVLRSPFPSRLLAPAATYAMRVSVDGLYDLSVHLICALFLS